MLNRQCSALLKSHHLHFSRFTEFNIAKGIRNASISSAIQKGIYSSRNSYPGRENRKNRGGRGGKGGRGGREGRENREDRNGWEGRKDRVVQSGRDNSTWIRPDRQRPSDQYNRRVRLMRDESRSDCPTPETDTGGYSKPNFHRIGDSQTWDRRDSQRRNDMASNKSSLSFPKNRRERNAERLAERSEQTEYTLERSPHTQPQVSITAPRSIPYTTAASEFVYGSSAVLAALRCGRRKLYKLYIHNAPDKVSLRLGRHSPRDPMLDTIIKFGLAAGVSVKQVAGNWPKLLEKMSGGRPHNGCILEASQLPKLPVNGLLAVESPLDNHFNVSVCQQSVEEADVNGTSGRIPRSTYRDGDSSSTGNDIKLAPRYPFALLLDGIRDEGNVGAIIRSAYYFGVDAIILSTRNSAPISAVAVKASAGAAENIPILTTTNPTLFLKNTHMNGWKFFAAEAPAAAIASQQSLSTSAEQILSRRDVKSKLNESPCILMLGSEDQGLQKSVRQQADGVVVIPGAITSTGEEDRAGVDSLNVSVASALLCEAFLGDPSSTGPGLSSSEEGMMSTVDLIREEAKEDPNKMF